MDNVYMLGLYAASVDVTTCTLGTTTVTKPTFDVSLAGYYIDEYASVSQSKMSQGISALGALTGSIGIRSDAEVKAGSCAVSMAVQSGYEFWSGSMPLGI